MVSNASTSRAIEECTGNPCAGNCATNYEEKQGRCSSWLRTVQRETRATQQFDPLRKEEHRFRSRGIVHLCRCRFGWVTGRPRLPVLSVAPTPPERFTVGPSSLRDGCIEIPFARIASETEKSANVRAATENFSSACSDIRKGPAPRFSWRGLVEAARHTL